MDMKELIARMTAIEESAKSEKEYDHDSLDKEDEDYIDGEAKKGEDKDKEDTADEDDLKESVKSEEDESDDDKGEEQELEECGGEMMSMPTSGQQDTVSMTINMSGSGKGGIHDILDVIRNIEKGKDGLGSMGGQEPLPVGDKELNKDATMIIGTSSDIEGDADQDMDHDMDRDVHHDESFVNSPEVKYAALKHILPSGDDMHKSKDMYSRAQPGDNPMAIKEKLESLYKFVKSK